MSDREVLVCPQLYVSQHPLTKRLFTDGSALCPFDPWPGQATPVTVLGQYAKLLERDLAEQDPDYLQIIPYILCRNGDNFLAYERQGSEQRLHGNWSVGLGGHVDCAYDGGRSHAELQEQFNALLWEEAKRELHEEAGIPSGQLTDTLPIGLIYTHDSSELVHKVHVGVVYVVDVKCDELSSDECGTFKYVTPAEVLDSGAFEPWSVLAVSLFDRMQATKKLADEEQTRVLACRPKGDVHGFYAPHRDVAHLGRAAIADVARLSTESRWDYLFDAMEAPASLLSDDSLDVQVNVAMEKLVALMNLATDLDNPVELGEAMRLSEFHRTPIAGRAAVLSMVGLSMIAAIWVGLRQEYRVGIEPEQDFERLWPVAAAVLRQYTGKQSRHDVKTIFRQAVKDFIDAGYTGAQAEHLLQEVVANM